MKTRGKRDRAAGRIREYLSHGFAQLDMIADETGLSPRSVGDILRSRPDLFRVHGRLRDVFPRDGPYRGDGNTQLWEVVPPATTPVENATPDNEEAMTTTQKRPKVGDECWFVEWVYELAWRAWGPGEQDRDLIHDACKTRTRQVTTREEAERVAREVYPQTTNAFATVQYWPARFMPYDEDDAAAHPHAGFWEATGETIEYAGGES